MELLPSRNMDLYSGNTMRESNMASLEIPSLNGDSLAITIPFWVVPKVNSPTKVDLFKNREEKSHWWILEMKEGWDGLIWPKHPHCATCCSRRPQLWVLPPNMDHGLPSLLMDSKFQIPQISSLFLLWVPTRK